MDNVLVSIRCITYNHAPYIRQCLDGFIMQRTNFKFEAIVHDDASTDETADIIREYAKKYPDIIKPIFQTENQYSKRNGAIRKALNEAMSKDSKYIAMCEGDDYWTDPLKLQKQVDFLENHHDYSMCFHEAKMRYEDESKDDVLFSKLEDRQYFGEEIYENWIVATASVVFKKNALESTLLKQCTQNKNFVYGDIILFICLSKSGKLFGMSDIMSVYRRHTGGIVYKISKKQVIGKIKHDKNIGMIFGGEFRKISKRIVSKLYVDLSIMEKKERLFFNCLYCVMYSFLYSPKVCITTLCKYFKISNNGREIVSNNPCV